MYKPKHAKPRQTVTYRDLVPILSITATVLLTAGLICTLVIDTAARETAKTTGMAASKATGAIPRTDTIQAVIPETALGPSPLKPDQVIVDLKPSTTRPDGLPEASGTDPVQPETSPETPEQTGPSNDTEPDPAEQASNQNGFTPSPDVPLSDDLQTVLHEATIEHDIPYCIALGLIQLESSFQTDALNEETLCYGLCQINPAYWPADLDPAGNIRQGMYILRYYLNRYDQDMDKALTAYHAGHDTGDRDYAGTVKYYASQWSEIIPQA